MDLQTLIQHPEQLDKETLYELRSLLALYPYYQTARLLMLQNLYLLHDPTFDEELRRAAIYITDRKVIFQMIEAAHYKISTPQQNAETATPKEGNRTITLINSFLNSLPADTENKQQPKRKPTPADAAVDYVSYLLEIENEEESKRNDTENHQMRGQDLIDNFIKNDSGKIELKETPEFFPLIEDNGLFEEKEGEESLARIYIKQGRYSKALEIIKRLNLNYPKKNAYFADQIRFLEKLIINNKYK